MMSKGLGGISFSGQSILGWPSARGLVATWLLMVAGLMLLSGCGGDEPEPSARAAPDAGEFPAADGRTIEQIAAGTEASELVVSPVGQVFRVGENRFAFGVFELDRSQVLEAEVALYVGHGEGGEASGPLPARIESMETRPSFAAMTTYQDDDAAQVVYVVDGVELDAPGEWRALALVREDGELRSARLPSVMAGAFERVPDIGEQAPVVPTPTPESVGGDLARIDTRVPPTDMHADLAEVLGEKPVVLVFATPALCQSRVCGPVVDVQAQVQAETGDSVEFIHMEIFNGNDPNQGVRPQVRRFGLPTEPWLFVIDADGRVVERIEGAFGLEELRDAVRKVADRR